MKVVSVFLLLFLSFVLSQRVRYDGHKVLRVTLDSPQELKRFKALLPETVDIWSHDSNLILGVNDIRVDSQLYANISSLGFKFETWIEDVEKYLTAPDVVVENSVGADPWYNDYRTFDLIHARLRQIAANYSDIATFVPSIGKSIEGRDIPALLLGAKTSPTVKRIFWTGGQHAREWIGPATVMYITEKLLTDNDAVTRDLLSKLQFVIIPLVNPDGYNYAWTRDRLWRKNRRANTGGSFGVDLNRNWDIKWGGAGSSSNPTSDTYHGTRAFSEPESKAVSDYLLSVNPNKNIIAAIDFHSYSQLILRPYGWTNANCPDETKLKNFGADMAAQIKSKSGLTYQNIKSIELYITTGTASDWYYEKGIVGAYTIELRDTGQYGFRLPASQIVPTGEETWAAVKKFTSDIAK